MGEAMSNRNELAEIVGYVVISRDGRVIGEQFGDRADAQTRADEWTNDCKAAGVEWDYRVAAIAEFQP